MKKLHTIIGLIVVVIFLLTGQYMEWIHNRVLPDGTRMLYRSRHIYLLLSGLINIGIGSYIQMRVQRWRRNLQIIGSVFILLTPALLLIGFFSEPGAGPDKVMAAPLGIFAVTIGSLLHLISGWRSSD